jgi:hypothetical protein
MKLSTIAASLILALSASTAMAQSSTVLGKHQCLARQNQALVGPSGSQRQKFPVGPEGDIGIARPADVRSDRPVPGRTGNDPPVNDLLSPGF